MNVRKRIITALFTIAFISVKAQSPAEVAKHEFSLQKCIEYGEKNNLQVKNALLDLQIQGQVNRNVTALAYPQINGGLGTTYNPNIAVQSFPNFIAAGTYGVLEHEGVKDGNGNPVQSPADFGFIQAAFGSKWNASAGVTLSQILFDGQVFVGLQARRTLLEFSQKNIELTKENIRANIYKVYYQLVVSKTQIDQLDANIERVEKFKHDAGELFKNGFVEKLDVDRATVQLANLQTEKSSILKTIENGYLGLKLLIGMPMKDALVLTDEITSDKIKEGLLNDGVYQYTDRNDFQYLSMAEKLGEYNIKRYKLSRLPSAMLNAAYNKTAQREKFNFFGSGDWFTSSYIGLSINIPIFDGYAKDANIKKTQFELQKIKNQVEYLKINIDNDVAISTNNFHNAINTLDFQKQNMTLAEQVYNQAKKKYEVGTGSTTDITNAQTDLRVSQSNYISAMYNAIIAKVDYLKAIGKL